MKKIGIIGLGWLGLPLAETLNKKGHPVWGTTRNDQDERFQGIHPNIERVKWTSGAVSEIEEKLKKTEILYITLPPSSFDGKTLEIIQNILPYLAKDTEVIYTSSIGAYRSKHGALDENSNLDESHPVVQTEKLLQSESNIQASIVRLGGLIGGKRHPVHYLVKKENDDPESPVQLIGLTDCVKVLATLPQLTQKKVVFNLVNPSKIDRRTYYTKVAQDLQITEPYFSDRQINTNPREVNSTIFASLFPEYKFESLYCFK